MQQHSMEQAVTLGAYAGTVALPLVREFGSDRSIEVTEGLVSELWAGLPLVHPVSFADPSVLGSDVDRTRTVRDSADGLEPAHGPADLVPDAVDMIRTLWQLTRQGSAQELAVVARFRLADLAYAMDHLYATLTGASPPPSRPGAFEAVVRECLDLVTGERSPSRGRQLSDCDLHEHGTRVGEQLLECVTEGAPCRLLTTEQVDRLRHQVMTALSVAGLRVVTEEEASPGVLLAVVDDVDLSNRHIELHWHCASDLRRRCHDALEAGDYTAEVLRHAGCTKGVMGQALQEILRHAGFEARIDPDIDEHHVLVNRLAEPERLRSYVSAATA